MSRRIKLVFSALCALLLPTPIVFAGTSVLGQGVLRVDPSNPRYFTNDTGRVVFLAGSHTWLDLQDGGPTDPPAAFDYTAWLDFLDRYGHNFFRLFVWEQADWTLETSGQYRFSPLPYARVSGSGVALDGKPKFDLTSFNQAYFDRLRERVVEAGQKGIYVSIMLFDGWSVDSSKNGSAPENPWKGHPFNANNNVNGLNGDPNGDNSGDETHTLQIAAVTQQQDAYVKKIIDTVDDLDNVVYEISNESNSHSEQWQYHMINLIKSYELTKPKQHPVGMTVEYPDGSNDDLYASPADWISPKDDGTYLTSPSAADGRKVIVLDTDHLGTQQIASSGYAWIWKSFLRGHNLLFMDQYDGAGTGVGANSSISPNDPRWVDFRKNLGYAKRYADKVDLGSMVPSGGLCSSGYCLARAAAGGEYLVYLPSSSQVTMNLSATPGPLAVEWFNPADGTTTNGGTITGGAANVALTSPFGSNAVLYLHQAANARPSPPTNLRAN